MCIRRDVIDLAIGFPHRRRISSWPLEQSFFKLAIISHIAVLFVMSCTKWMIHFRWLLILVHFRWLLFGATKSYFINYSRVVIILPNTDWCKSAFSTYSFKKLAFHLLYSSSEENDMVKLSFWNFAFHFNFGISIEKIKKYGLLSNHSFQKIQEHGSWKGL